MMKLALLCLRAQCMCSTLQVSDWFLSFWVAHPDANDQSLYAGFYAVSVVGVIVMALITGTTFALVTVSASRTLHDSVFASVMRAPMGWFDMQPTGRILSRFTGDIDQVRGALSCSCYPIQPINSADYAPGAQVDVALPYSLENSADNLMQCFLAVVLISVFLPWFLFALPVIAVVFYTITGYFRRAVRELKRLDGLSRSPLVSHVQAVMAGLPSIRAYGQQGRYAADARLVVDQQTLTFCETCRARSIARIDPLWPPSAPLSPDWFYALNRWVGIRLDWITTCIAFLTVALCVASRDSLQPGLAGLTVVYALRTGGVFQFALRLAAEAEANLTAVERLRHYSSAIPQEAVTTRAAYSEMEAQAALEAALPSVYAGIDVLSVGRSGVTAAPSAVALVVSSSAEQDAGGCSFDGWYPRTWSQVLVNSQWPRSGDIEFKGLSVRYRADTPLVLRDMSLYIKGGLRVGVCGRTGRCVGDEPCVFGLGVACTCTYCSGKTTLSLAIMRMLEPSDGQILVDGLDISRLSLYQLRSRIAVIPQVRAMAVLGSIHDLFPPQINCPGPCSLCRRLARKSRPVSLAYGCGTLGRR